MGRGRRKIKDFDFTAVGEGPGITIFTKAPGWSDV